MISIEKVMNIEVVELIKIYNFILVIFSSDKVVVTLFTKFTYPSYSLCNVTTTLSDEKITKIKVIDFDKFYNFYVHDFFS